VLCTNIFTFYTFSDTDDTPPIAQSVEQSTLANVLEVSEENTNLASFLIRRAAYNSNLANYLYWYLYIEVEDFEGGVMKKVRVFHKKF
jgi:hypothetical protein